MDCHLHEFKSAQAQTHLVRKIFSPSLRCLLMLSELEHDSEDGDENTSLDLCVGQR